MNEFLEIRSGIYFLCKNRRIIYIGKARDVWARVNNQSAFKEFDSAIAMLAPEGILDEVEQYWIKRIKPELNIQYHMTDKKKLLRPRITKAFSITVPKEFLPVIKRMAFESGHTVSSYLSSLIRKDTKDL